MNELQSISQLFQNRLFRIPDYQRGYAWKNEQLCDFWDDLVNLHKDRYHYTGLLSLRQLSRKEVASWQNESWLIENSYKPCHVVDGQQRLTTIIILINELIHFVCSLPENSELSESKIVLGFETLEDIRTKYICKKRPPMYLVTSYLFGYETDNPTADYLQYRIFCEPYSGTIEETYYTKNLKYAKDFFDTHLNELYSKEGEDGLVQIYKKLTQKLMFNIHEIDDDYDVFVAFETMNNRGKPLTNLELLKNRLIYLTTLFDDSVLDLVDKNELRKQINEAWKEVYYQLGRNQSVSLSDDEFLRAHWIIFFQYSRQRGTDYIKFLLNRFSPKNIYEKHVVAHTEPDDTLFEDSEQEEDENAEDSIQTAASSGYKLQPTEIADYVNSLKEMAKYWYYTYFPYESDLTIEEKHWLDRLNRIGIGYFRPLVVSALTPVAHGTAPERVALFKAIERFIFICFRMGMFQASYQSSTYYRKAKDVYYGSISVADIAEELNQSVSSDTESAVGLFVKRMDTRFSSGDGFYSWRDLRYMLYEYESFLSDKNKLRKVDWAMFTKVEKDKITIEHILPQTPSKWYWQNQFRMYNTQEIKTLSASLGNLLPLAHSINSGLQNDSFHDKKVASSSGRRGYENGSHSEIEVAKETDWDARRILERGMKLLGFMEKRWDFQFESESQKLDLLHLGFVTESRDPVDEIPAPEVSLSSEEDAPSGQHNNAGKRPARQIRREKFWNAFVSYCKVTGRMDIGGRKPSGDNWYDVPIQSNEYHIFFNLIGFDTLRVGLYVYTSETFSRLESKKQDIENACGFELDWYSSKEKSIAKRILYAIKTDIYADDNQVFCFDWLISHCDKLRIALQTCDALALHGKEHHSKITMEMTQIAYDMAKQVYSKSVSLTEGRELLVKETGMNSASAGDYINNFLAMMSGKCYCRTMNSQTTRYYLERISEDYGKDALNNALTACEEHTKYYATLGYGQLKKIEQIIVEYKE